MTNKVKRFLQNQKNTDIENLLLLSIQSNAYLLERWCYLDMINSGEEATRETMFEFIGVENEMLRRGYGDEKGCIMPRKIGLLYELLNPTKKLFNKSK